MFPSKSMVDYMSEIHRLFPRSENEDSPSLAFNTFLSPFQSTRANRSSSSTDSTSPESYPETFHSGEFVKRDEKLPSNNTYPFTYRQQRPIIGRKILGTQHAQTLVPPTMEKMDFDISFWQHEEPLPETPPENTSQSKNFLYELFPSDTKAIEFQTPVKSMQSSQLSEFSGIWSNNSPTLSKRSPIERNVSNLSPTLTYQSHISNPSPGASHLSPPWSNSSQSSTFSSHVPNNFINTFNVTRFTPNYSNVGTCSSSDEIAPTKMCTFCRKNGETPVVYMTHCVKQKIGNKNVVTCPILRSHVCGTCGASGDNAHTITYCPVLRSNNDGKPLQSTTITLKNTRIKSNGRRRY